MTTSPGEGYRFVNKKEPLADGDEYTNWRGWAPISRFSDFCAGAPIPERWSHVPVRRRIEYGAQPSAPAHTEVANTINITLNPVVGSAREVGRQIREALARNQLTIDPATNYWLSDDPKAPVAPIPQPTLCGCKRHSVDFGADPYAAHREYLEHHLLYWGKGREDLGPGWSKGIQPDASRALTVLGPDSTGDDVCADAPRRR